MNFTYKVESYIASEKRLFVVYTPANTDLAPFGSWIHVNDSDTEEQIVTNIIQNVPLSKWSSPVNSAAEGLVNTANTATYTGPIEPIRTASSAERVRFERYALLTECDWTQLPDAPLTTEQKQAWEEYRQALRDVPSQVGFPDTVVWPTTP